LFINYSIVDKPWKDSPGQPGQNSQCRISRTGHLGQGTKDKADRRDNENMTKIQDNRALKLGTSMLEQDSWDRKAWAGQPGQDSWRKWGWYRQEKRRGQDGQKMTVGQSRRVRTPEMGQSWQESHDSKVGA
jgi:hypothetical protein